MPVDPRHQQDRPARCPHRGRAQRGLRPLHRPRRERGADRVPHPVHECQARRRPSETGGRIHRPCSPSSRRLSTHIPGPEADDTKSPQFLVTNLDYDSYVGQIGLGRMMNGILEMNRGYTLCGLDRNVTGVKFSALYTFHGLKKKHGRSGRVGRHRRRCGRVRASTSAIRFLPGEPASPCPASGSTSRPSP